MDIGDIIERVRKSIKPTSMVAELRDGSRKPLTLASGRARWVALARVLEALDWRAIECFGRDGGLLDIIRSDDGDDGDDGDTGVGETLAPVPMPLTPQGEIGTIIVSAVTQVLDRWNGTFGPALHAMSEVQRLTAERLARLEGEREEREERARMEAQVAAETAKLEHAEDGEGNGHDRLVGKIIEVAGPELVRAAMSKLAGRTTPELPPGSPS